MAFKGMAQINKKDLWTIPNLITYFRILCIPAFVTLMALAGVRSDTTLLYWGAGVFAVATASDLVDGFIARKFNMTSGIGMVLDPFAASFFACASAQASHLLAKQHQASLRLTVAGMCITPLSLQLCSKSLQ